MFWVIIVASLAKATVEHDPMRNLFDFPDGAEIFNNIVFPAIDGSYRSNYDAIVLSESKKTSFNSVYWAKQSLSILSSGQKTDHEGLRSLLAMDIALNLVKSNPFDPIHGNISMQCEMEIHRAGLLINLGRPRSALHGYEKCLSLAKMDISTAIMDDFHEPSTPLPYGTSDLPSLQQSDLLRRMGELTLETGVGDKSSIVKTLKYAIDSYFCNYMAYFKLAEALKYSCSSSPPPSSSSSNCGNSDSEETCKLLNEVVQHSICQENMKQLMNRTLSVIKRISKLKSSEIVLLTELPKKNSSKNVYCSFSDIFNIANTYAVSHEHALSVVQSTMYWTLFVLADALSDRLSAWRYLEKARKLDSVRLAQSSYKLRDTQARSQHIKAVFHQDSILLKELQVTHIVLIYYYIYFK